MLYIQYTTKEISVSLTFDFSLSIYIHVHFFLNSVDLCLYIPQTGNWCNGFMPIYMIIYMYIWRGVVTQLVIDILAIGYIHIYIYMHMRVTLFLLWCLPARMALSPGTVATPTQQQSSEDRVSARHDSNSNSHINIFINCTLLISAPVKDFDWNTKYQTIHRVQFTYFGGAYTHNEITKTLSWDNRVWAQCHQAHIYIYIHNK